MLSSPCYDDVMAGDLDMDPKLIVLLALGSTVGIGALVAVPLIVVFFFVYPPPGDVVVSQAIEPGERFSLSYRSDGSPQRVWLDLDCRGCGSGVLRGKLVASTKKGRVATHTVERVTDGFSVRKHSSAGRYVRRGHLLFSIPAQPRGRRVTISGRLRAPRPVQIDLGSGKRERGPRPRFAELRLFVAP